MWTLINHTPYAVGRNWVYDANGAPQWVVAIKGSFDLSSRGVVLADEQLEPALAPEYFGEPGKSSLRFDADLGLQKPTTDVIVNAFAHAPGGQATSRVEVTLRLGALHKTLRVHGERVYGYVGGVLAPSAPKPFERCPIRYEHAFGGADLSDPDPQRRALSEQNPIGRGVAFDARTLDGTPAHSVEYPSGSPHAQPPASFGALDGWWTPRRQLAGSYDERWETERKPYLPSDYHADFTLSSPLDQRAKAYLQGGECVELQHMTPEGNLRFQLPTVRLQLETTFGTRKHAHGCALVSVVIEPESHKLLLVWQSSLTVPRPDVDYLDQTVIKEARS